LINLVGMDSPGLTSAPAVAEIVADLLEDKDVPGVRS
jgi:glycine/D-amino acid oxidase-like deaminating enzyme